MRRWLMTMPPAQNGTTYFNFIASHDGIGLRPVEGLLDEAQLERMVAACSERGGRISWRARAGQAPSPYEINIALFDALSGTTGGADEWAVARMVCAHAIMLGLEGIPGLYIHSLLATPNDLDKLANTGQNRAINRHQWDADALQAALADDGRPHRAVFEALSQLIRLRAQQPAFHPNATQFTLQLGDACLGFWRQSMDRRQSIFCISNVSAETQVLRVSDVNLIAMQSWRDLIGGQPLSPQQSELLLAPYQTLWLTNV
jgi:sucrose phosphorylase